MVNGGGSSPPAYEMPRDAAVILLGTVYFSAQREEGTWKGLEAAPEARTVQKAGWERVWASRRLCGHRGPDQRQRSG